MHISMFNMAVPFRITSKINTAVTGGPMTATAATLIPMEMRISMGWNLRPVVTSISRSAWCTMWSRHSRGTEWNMRCCRYMEMV